MTFKITHRSSSDLRIIYSVDTKPPSKMVAYVTLIVVAAIAIQLEIDLRILGVGYLMFILIKGRAKTQRSRTLFAIELTHVENLISVKNFSRGGIATTTYPLNSFRGFGLYKLPPSKKLKDRALAELFFIFDDTVGENFLTSENSLINVASKVKGENGNIFWHIPIQKKHHPTTLWKARKIIGTTDNWLARASHGQRQINPPQKIEIIRDFRDIE